MLELTLPRLLLSGVSSDSYAPEICLGLLEYFKVRQLAVSVCLIGSDLKLATMLERQTGRAVRSLDPQLLSFEDILIELHSASVGAEFLLIVTPFGFYDSERVGEFRGTAAEIAARTQTPVLLTINADSFGNGALPLIRGYQGLVAGLNIVGAIFIQNTGSRHAHRIADVESFKKLLAKLPSIQSVITLDAQILNGFNLPEGASANLNNATLEHSKITNLKTHLIERLKDCLLYTSPSPRDKRQSRMPSSA